MTERELLIAITSASAVAAALFFFAWLGKCCRVAELCGELRSARLAEETIARENHESIVKAEKAAVRLEVAEEAIELLGKTIAELRQQPVGGG